MLPTRDCERSLCARMSRREVKRTGCCIINEARNRETQKLRRIFPQLRHVKRRFVELKTKYGIRDICLVSVAIKGRARTKCIIHRGISREGRIVVFSYGRKRIKKKKRELSTLFHIFSSPKEMGKTPTWEHHIFRAN